MHIFHSIRVNDSYVWNIINLLHVLSVNLMLRNLQGNILFHKVMIFCDNLYTVTKWSRLSTFLSVCYVLGEIVVCARFLITGEMRHLALFRDIHYFEINYIYQNLIVFTFLNRDVKRIYWPKGLLVICKSWAQDQFEL